MIPAQFGWQKGLFVTSDKADLFDCLRKTDISLSTPTPF